MRLLHENTVHDSSGMVLMRSRLRAVARRMGFSDNRRSEIELACAELYTNQDKFAGGSGLIQIWEVSDPVPALDVFAIDYGPGISNLPAALRDGYSTAGTLGKGLGAVSRLASEFDIYSMPQRHAAGGWHGLAVWCRFCLPAVAPAPGAFRIGRYLRAYKDAPSNGDALQVGVRGTELDWIHVDGLGHGAAAAAAVARLAHLLEHVDSLPARFAAMDRRLRGSRGAVAIIGRLEQGRGKLYLGGVGDMKAWMICNGERRSFNFAPGVVGFEHRSLRLMEMAFPSGALLLSASDGIQSGWDLDTLPYLWRKHPQLIAFLMGFLMGRQSDDKSLLVVDMTATQPAGRALQGEKPR